MNTLYESWLNRIDSYYEEQFFEPIVEELSQYRGGTTDDRVAKGKLFNAGYEVFIYAFFLGLYYGERRPLIGENSVWICPHGAAKRMNMGVSLIQ